MILFILTFERILVPMDEVQTDHLKAYGLAYWSVKNGYKTWWVLNYRGGSFMMEFNKEILIKASKMGVYVENLNQLDLAEIYSIVEKKNMEIVELVRAPKVAVYAPPYNRPWDDAVELALTYAEIPYDKIWDEEVLNGKIMEYDWLHLHHEDFTGMLGKFWASYQFTDWYNNIEKINLEMAKKLGFKDIPSLKKAIARKIRDFVASGKFLFAMCAAPITLDISLASQNVDIADVPFDGTPVDPNYNEKLDYSQTFAFKDFKVITDPF
ncbi:MAG: asparagine synthetase B, partial [candidate division WOR-3 bacterium]